MHCVADEDSGSSHPLAVALGPTARPNLPRESDLLQNGEDCNSAEDAKRIRWLPSLSLALLFLFPSLLALFSYPTRSSSSLAFRSEIVNMNDPEKPTYASEVEAQPTSKDEPVYDVGEKVDYDRTGAIDAENIEHEMTVLQAAKAYPAASWWAFVMSCTIVSSCP